MALADPQTITIDSTPYTLNCVDPGGTKSLYQTSDEALKLQVSHQSNKDRTRSLIRVDQRVVAADPLTSENEYKTAGVYLVIDKPEYGFTSTQLDNIVQGLKTLIDSTFVGKVLGGEH